MSEYVYANTASQTIDIFLQDSSSSTGQGLSGLVFNSASLVASYRKGATGSRTAITLATQTVGGAYSSGGFVEIDATNMKGVYRLDIPNAAVDTEGFVTLYLYGATNLLPTALRIDCRPLPVDVKKYGGIAGTFASGIPSVNTTQFAGQTITAAAGVTIPSSIASPTNITAGTITTVTTLTNLPSIPSGWLTAAGIAADAITASKIADGAIDTATFASGTTLPRVTLVDTTTTNSDMRGTDSAALAATALSTAVWTATIANRIDVAVSTRLAPLVAGRDLSVAATTGAVELDSAARVKLDAVQPDYAPLLASGYTAPANSDITAIKAKTDNLPSDPADQSLIIVATDAVMARLGAPAGLSMSADLAAVKLETGTTLPAQIAALNNLSSAQVVSALGSGTWATALPWNAAWDSEVQSEVQDAIEVNNLDHLLKIAVDTNFATTVHLDSVVGHIADNGTAATFVRTTDSLEAIRDNQSSGGGASLEDIIAGVQSVSGGIIAAQDSSAFYITSGDTWTQDVNALGNIVGKTLVFTIKRNARDADTAALVLIHSTDGLTRLAGAAASNSAWGSLTVLNDTLGNIRLTLKSDATLLLKSGTYADGIKSLEVGDDMTLRQRGKTIISTGVINDIS